MRIVYASFIALLAALALTATPAFAETETLTPWWHITSGARPGVLPAATEGGNGEGEVYDTITNVGDATASFEGSTAPVRIVDTLPAGLKATKVDGTTPNSNRVGNIPCTVEESGSRVSCEFVGGSGGPPDTGGLSFGGQGINGLPPYHSIEVRIRVLVEPAASAPGEQNEVSVSGGEGSVCQRESESADECPRVATGPIPSASVKRTLRVGGAPTPFGVEASEMTFSSAGGGVDTQAGSHPFEATFTTVMNQGVDDGTFEPGQYGKPFTYSAGGLTKDLRFKLPPGFVGNPQATPRCSLAEFLGTKQDSNDCPADTAVGVATVTYNVGTGGVGVVVETVPLFNVEPSYGEPARFAFYLPTGGFGVYIDTSVETGGDYGVISTVPNIPDTAVYLSSEVTFWGTPDSPAHNGERGWGCTLGDNFGSIALEEYQISACGASGGEHPAPLLDLPTSCAGQLQMSVEADSWQDSGQYTSPLYAPELPALDGCNQLQFAPEIEVTPDGQQASEPTGVDVDVHVPQEGQLDGEGRAQSNIKDIEVTLPAGLTLNPSAADGLEACSEQLIGYEGARESPLEPGVSNPAFTSKLPGSYGSSVQLEPGVNFCPNASKIATVTIKTPLLPNPLEGAVYLASPQNFGVFPSENPFGTHVAMYVVAEDPTAGILVKLPGKVELGGAPGVEGLAPGQIRSTFEDNPQLPFEDAELHFLGGERAPLATPSRCGTYTTQATYTPWSGGEAVHSSSSFQITSGPGGSACPGASLPFSPELHSSVSNINAGSFSNLSTTLSRPSGDQNIQSVTLHYPPGLSGLLSGVELCPEPQANQGTCGKGSEIGETIVSVGVGGEPFTVTGGKVYITGPYNGTGSCTVGEPGCAPFGLSIANPAKAGPFDLQEGRPVVVRAKIEINPYTAALTITTNQSLPGAIPTIIEGFPLQIQHVNVNVNREHFTFNPTSCAPVKVEGTIESSEKASSAISDAFQVTNCAALKFTPKFSVSTSGKTSKADGASLTAKVTEPSEPHGSQANLTKVKVELPKALPSRLTTLQKACTNKQFEANPAGCPSASKIGYATVHTPLLPVPLTGPAIFVSHGGEAFPSLTMVLQGYGVTIDLVGATYISPKGVTSTTFKTVPDQPFSTFELTLPQGPYSALGSNKDLCALTHMVTTSKKVALERHGKVVKRDGKVVKVTKKTTKRVSESLQMPNEFIGQNGAAIHEVTKIAVTGCPKTEKAKKAKQKKGKKGKKK